MTEEEKKRLEEIRERRRIREEMERLKKEKEKEENIEKSTNMMSKEISNYEKSCISSIGILTGFSQDISVSEY